MASVVTPVNATSPNVSSPSTAEFTLSEILEATRGRLRSGGDHGRIRGMATDSRTLQPGQAFLAIRGPHFDGHAFTEEARSRGAGALIVEAGAGPAAAAGLPVIEVDQTTVAFGDLALAHRRRFAVPVIAVTGSCGKTTTKEMIAAVLGASRRVLASVGTDNNQIGVPQTLLRLQPEHQAVVLEMGTNHPGELARLCAIAQPTIGVVTNIGLAHLEFFGSLAGVLQEKLTLVRALSGADLAIVNGDDPLIRRALTTQPPAARQLTYGIGRSCDVQARRIEPLASGTRFTIEGPGVAEPTTVTLPLLGRHNVINALAAAACGVPWGLPPQEIAAALAQLRPVAMRLEPVRRNGLTILNDCYNANPTSMRQALEVLREHPGPRPRVFICGDMAELGPGAPQFHREVGRWAREAQVDVIIAIGRHAQAVLEGAVTAGRGGEDRACATLAEAEASLEQLPLVRATVLVKGSRAMGLERIVDRLMERAA